MDRESNQVTLPQFIPFPSIPRLSKTMVITEKIDGTNAVILVNDSATDLIAGSRSRWLDTSKHGDNFGFAKWVQDHRDELLALGPGTHFGEWWGAGIQRRYGLSEKRFSLFNSARWSEDRPECCSVVPVLHQGEFSTSMIDSVLEDLAATGSQAAPGFMKPEGVVVYHSASRTLFKKTFDDTHKGS